MKKNQFLLISILFLFISCGNNAKKSTQDAESEIIELDETTITAFAKQIESSLYLSNSQFFNQAFEIGRASCRERV